MRAGTRHDREHMDYWKNVHAIALKSTRESLGLSSWGQIVLKVIVLAAVLSGLAFWGSDDAAKDEIVGRAFIAGVVSMLFPVVYFFHIFRIPALLERETKAEMLHKEEQLALALRDKAELSIKIFRIGIGDTRDGHVGYSITVHVANTGTRPTSIPFWAFGIRRVGVNDVEQMKLVRTMGNITLGNRDGSTDIYNGLDSIVSQAKQSIAPGAFLTGVTACVDDSGTPSKVGDEILVTCQDIFGVEHEAWFPVTGIDAPENIYRPRD